MGVSMETICVDTEIIWQYLLNKKDAVEMILQAQKTAALAMTSLTLFELYVLAGHSEKPLENKAVVDALVRRVSVIAFHARSAEVAAKVQEELGKEKKKMELRDLWEAIMCREADCLLLTTTLEQYKDIPGLKLYK